MGFENGQQIIEALQPVRLNSALELVKLATVQVSPHARLADIALALGQFYDAQPLLGNFLLLPSSGASLVDGAPRFVSKDETGETPHFFRDKKSSIREGNSRVLMGLVM